MHLRGREMGSLCSSKCLVVIWACFCVLTAAAFAQDKSAGVSNKTPNLQLSVRTDRVTYSMKDKLHIEVQLTNVGQSDVYVWRWIFCWGQGPALSIHALDQKGEWVQPKSSFLLDCLPPTPKEHDASQFIRIEPGRFYGVTDDFNLPDLVDGPGKRTLEIGLSGVLSKEIIREFGFPNLPYWTSDDKPLFARVRIRVIL